MYYNDNIDGLNFDASLFLDKLEPIPEEFKSNHDRSFKMREKRYPYSVTMQEGAIMHHYIREHGLQSGFEIATAFGVSTMFLGNAFRATHGRLVTVDAYIEESFEDFKYGDIDAEVAKIREAARRGNYPLGYRYVTGMIAAYDLENVVEARMCLSPWDLTGQLPQIDFAFIDGGHFGLQPLHDTVEAIAQMKGERKALFFHDNNDNPATTLAISYASQKLRQSSVRLPTKYGLTVVTTLR